MVAKTNPEYILVRNNAGHTPLQILCKNGRIDERIISTFAQMGGPEIFSVKDSNGNTPLHSAMRNDIDLVSLRCLLRASPLGSCSPAISAFTSGERSSSPKSLPSVAADGGDGAQHVDGVPGLNRFDRRMTESFESLNGQNSVKYPAAFRKFY